MYTKITDITNFLGGRHLNIGRNYFALLLDLFDAIMFLY